MSGARRRAFRGGVRFGRAARSEGGRSIDRLDRELLASLDDGFRNAAERAGAWLRCAPGCSKCCLGPFPITRLDVRRLREGWFALRAADPGRAEAVRRRARRAVAVLREGYPGDSAGGRPAGDEQALDRFFARHASMPCPVLDPRTGRCELYAARPVSCRVYGPPLRFEEFSVPPCRLCFRGADAETVDRCRFEPDPPMLGRPLWRQIIHGIVRPDKVPRPPKPRPDGESSLGNVADRLAQHNVTGSVHFDLDLRQLVAGARARDAEAVRNLE